MSDLTRMSDERLEVYRSAAEHGDGKLIADVTAQDVWDKVCELVPALIAERAALDAAEADRDWLASTAADLDSMLAGERKRWDGPAFTAKTTQSAWLQAARQARESHTEPERGEK